MAQGTHRAPRRCHHYDRWRPIEWNQPWPGNTEDLITNKHRQGNNKVQSQSWPFLGIGKPKELFRYIWNLRFFSQLCVIFKKSLKSCGSMQELKHYRKLMDFHGFSRVNVESVMCLCVLSGLDTRTRTCLLTFMCREAECCPPSLTSAQWIRTTDKI